jgi:transcription antitermination factor NusG
MNVLEELRTINTGIKVDLSGLNIEDLKDVVAEANRLIRKKEYETKLQRKEKAKNDLKAGDIVSVCDGRFKNEIWEVIKLNPLKVKCRRENGEIWNISYSHIIIEQ